MAAAPVFSVPTASDVLNPDAELTIVVAGAFANGDDFAFAWLFLGAIGDDDAASRLFFGFYAANQHAIVQRTKCHNYDLPCLNEYPIWHSHPESASGAHLGSLAR